MKIGAPYTVNVISAPLFALNNGLSELQLPIRDATLEDNAGLVHMAAWCLRGMQSLLNFCGQWILFNELQPDIIQYHTSIPFRFAEKPTLDRLLLLSFDQRIRSELLIDTIRVSVAVSCRAAAVCVVAASISDSIERTLLSASLGACLRDS